MTQKTPIQKTILRWVIGFHAVLILCAVVVPTFQKLFKPKKKEIITFVTFGDGGVPEPAPEIQPAEVERLPDPEQAPLPEPKPEPEKPKWKPAVVKPQNKRIIKNAPKPAPVTPQRKRISSSDIRNALNTNIGGTIDPHGGYYNTVMQRMYGVWQVPVGAPMGLSALGSITVSSNGSVSNRQLIRSSGDMAFDHSVQKALNAVNRLPSPPTDLPNRTITIEFAPQ